MAIAGNITVIVKNLKYNNIFDLDLTIFAYNSDKLNEMQCELLKTYQSIITNDDTIELGITIFSPDEIKIINLIFCEPSL